MQIISHVVIEVTVANLLNSKPKIKPLENIVRRHQDEYKSACSNVCRNGEDAASKEASSMKLNGTLPQVAQSVCRVRVKCEDYFISARNG